MNQSQRDVKEKLLGLTHSKRVVTGCGRRGPLRRPWGCHTQEQTDQPPGG